MTKQDITTKREINGVQKQMLTQMLDWFEYSYNTDWFDDILIDGRKVMKPELLKNMRELREMGLVEMFRGGLNDDGEVVGGTHFSIIYEKRAEIKELLKGANEKYR